jgi:hypothetical protein
MIERLAAVVTLFAATSGSAFAVFTVPGEPTVPEPATAALVAAGALAVVGGRYLSKRKGGK